MAYTSNGQRRFNQPFSPTSYGPAYVQGDVIGVGYRPRTGTIFFTRNGKKLEDVAHGLKSQNLFPAVGANGPCAVHVNFGQSGFVFIEANVKKWGLAPMTGSLAPPPPYGSEQGSILLETGRESAAAQGGFSDSRHGRTRSGNNFRGHPTSPGPVRSPTDISLAHLVHVPSHDDGGEGMSSSGQEHSRTHSNSITHPPQDGLGIQVHVADHTLQPPPDYSSPPASRRGSDSSDEGRNGENQRLLGNVRRLKHSPPIPSYNDAVAEGSGTSPRTEDRERSRSGTV